MRYSLRKRVIDFISIKQKLPVDLAFHAVVYNWLDAADPFTEKPGPRIYRLDPEHSLNMSQSFQTHSKERAAHFSVTQRCICYGLKTSDAREKKDIHLQGTMPSKTGDLSHPTSDGTCERKNTCFC